MKHFSRPVVQTIALHSILISLCLSLGSCNGKTAQRIEKPNDGNTHLKLDEVFVGTDFLFYVSASPCYQDNNQFDGFSFALDNTSKTKILRFDPFDERSVQLVDEHGNRYEFRADSFTSKNTMSIRPGESRFPGFRFEAPVDAANKFKLTCDAANLGFKGSIIVEFTKAEYAASMARLTKGDSSKKSESPSPVPLISAPPYVPWPRELEEEGATPIERIEPAKP